MRQRACQSHMPCPCKVTQELGGPGAPNNAFSKAEGTLNAGINRHEIGYQADRLGKKRALDALAQSGNILVRCQCRLMFYREQVKTPVGVGKHADHPRRLEAAMGILVLPRN